MAKVIDLFSGAGGFSSGFVKSNFEIVSAVEYDESIAKTYVLNHPDTKMFVDDIANVDPQSLGSNISVIIGGPPCQGFSMAGSRIRGGFIDDPRNYLFKHYYKIVRYILPKVFVIENVKGLLTMQNGEIYNEIIKLFSNINSKSGQKYQLKTFVLNTKEFGIPQNRERVIIFGVLNNKQINFDELFEKTKYKILSKHKDFFEYTNVENAISNLPLATKNGIIKSPKPTSNYQIYLKGNDEKIFNHQATRHSQTAIYRMNQIKPGENYTSLNETIKSIHSGSYGRLEWHKRAPTITTRFDTPAGGRFIHPQYDRTLTPREAARIQSFSDDYKFIGTKSSVTTQIGNAVPPKLSYFLAELTKLILKEIGE